MILEKNERSYGEFTMIFKIPDNYERKWVDFEVNDGVLKLCYEKDNDEANQINNKDIEEEE